MKPLVRPGGFVPALDGTEIDPFLNPADARSAGLPDMPEGLGLAAGRMRPGVTSAIHVHPVVTQVTYVVDGRLTVRMREAGREAPREFVARPGDGVLTPPGVPLQFANETDTDIRVLYVTTPAYVSVHEAGRSAYDDAMLLADWSVSLSDADRHRARLRREAALRRIRGG